MPRRSCVRALLATLTLIATFGPAAPARADFAISLFSEIEVNGKPVELDQLIVPKFETKNQLIDATLNKVKVPYDVTGDKSHDILVSVTGKLLNPAGLELSVEVLKDRKLNGSIEMVYSSSEPILPEIDNRSHVSLGLASGQLPKKTVVRAFVGKAATAKGAGTLRLEQEATGASKPYTVIGGSFDGGLPKSGRLLWLDASMRYEGASASFLNVTSSQGKYRFYHAYQSKSRPDLSLRLANGEAGWIGSADVEKPPIGFFSTMQTLPVVQAKYAGVGGFRTGKLRIRYVDQKILRDYIVGISDFSRAEFLNKQDEGEVQLTGAGSSIGKIELDLRDGPGTLFEPVSRPADSSVVQYYSRSNPQTKSSRVVGRVLGLKRLRITTKPAVSAYADLGSSPRPLLLLMDTASDGGEVTTMSVDVPTPPSRFHLARLDTKPNLDLEMHSSDQIPKVGIKLAGFTPSGSKTRELRTRLRNVPRNVKFCMASGDRAPGDPAYACARAADVRGKTDQGYDAKRVFEQLARVTLNVRTSGSDVLSKDIFLGTKINKNAFTVERLHMCSGDAVGSSPVEETDICSYGPQGGSGLSASNIRMGQGEVGFTFGGDDLCDLATRQHQIEDTWNVVGLHAPAGIKMKLLRFSKVRKKTVSGCPAAQTEEVKSSHVTVLMPSVLFARKYVTILDADPPPTDQLVGDALGTIECPDDFDIRLSGFPKRVFNAADELHDC